MQLLGPGCRIHMIGIGGSGLSAIARVLHGWGYFVTGSDQLRSTLTDALLAEGICVQIGHGAENLDLPDGTFDPANLLVVVSSAVPDDNPEVVAARHNGIRVIKRRQLLEELTRDKITIAVAGTHGKTTTTSMIAWILIEAGLDPSFVSGGVLQNLGTNARAGAGPHFAIEADEYDRAFLGLWPDVAVVTIVEHDHPDCYPTFGELQAAFAEFAGRAVSKGRLIISGEDTASRLLAEQALSALRQPESPQSGSMDKPGVGSTESRVDTYGIGPGWTWQAEDVQLNGCPTFRVRCRGKRLGQCALQVPGRHNVLNALAALAATVAVGVEFDSAAAALARFRGTARRFEVRGHVGGITIVDDYAHHPTEIRATLAAARSKYPGRVLWAVFQPHTFSRTAALLSGFAAAFGDADHVVVTSIFAAREHDSGVVSGADIVARMAASGQSPLDSHYVETVDDAVAWLLARIEPGAVVITLGAGDVYRIGEQVLEQLRSSDAGGPAAPGAGPSDFGAARRQVSRPWLR
jgi:UDP-N-acetylmuramate--alanine ligase